MLPHVHIIIPHHVNTSEFIYNWIFYINIIPLIIDYDLLLFQLLTVMLLQSYYGLSLCTRCVRAQSERTYVAYVLALAGAVSLCGYILWCCRRQRQRGVKCASWQWEFNVSFRTCNCLDFHRPTGTVVAGEALVRFPLPHPPTNHSSCLNACILRVTRGRKKTTRDV